MQIAYRVFIFFLYNNSHKYFLKLEFRTCLPVVGLVLKFSRFFVVVVCFIDVVCKEKIENLI